MEVFDTAKAIQVPLFDEKGAPLNKSFGEIDTEAKEASRLNKGNHVFVELPNKEGIIVYKDGERVSA